MTALLLSLLAPFRRALAWAGGALVVIAGVWFAAKRDAKRDGETDALQRHIDTNKEVRRYERDAETQDDLELVRRLTRKP